MADFNNQNNGPKVTTSLLTMWDGNNNGIQLRVSGMDTGLGIAFWIPTLSPEGKRTYPKEGRISTILTPKNTIALEKIITTRILESYESGKNASAALYTNNAHTTILEIEVNNGEFYAHLHQNCDAVSHKPGNTSTFKFDMVWVNDNFNRETGEFQPVPIQGDFYLFTKMLQAYNNFSQGAVAGHGVRTTNHYFNTNLMDYMRAIATAVQAQIPMNRNYSNNFENRGNSQFGQGQRGLNQQTPQNPNATPVITEVADISDLIY